MFDPKPKDKISAPPGFTPGTLTVPAELAAAEPDHVWWLEPFSVSAHRGRDGFWIVTRREGRGGIALRIFPVTGAYHIAAAECRDDSGQWRIETDAGVYDVALRLQDGVMRMTTRLTPSRDLLVAFWPRDLYPLDEHDDPCAAGGRVEAGQRGLNAGFCYLCLNKPAFGSVLYMQDFSALNDFFFATRTKPDGVVGGLWPELGYQPPGAPMANTPPKDPLPEGRPVVISDVRLAFNPACAPDEFAGARHFVDMLAAVYPYLDKPRPVRRDWPGRADRTLHDLKASPDIRERHFGDDYLRPYVAAEVPDSMVQMTVLQALREYEQAFGVSDPLGDDLAAGMDRFFDAGLGTLRRYLPDVGGDKNRDAVDSWYLYHPLMNLGRLALGGEAWADDLFRRSIGFAVKAARHFSYRWPIQYDLRDFSVIRPDRGDGLGQTDVGGIYAYVMLLAHELTGDEDYVAEARAALKALEDAQFELVYQTNLTGWGLVACLKLWKLDNDSRYLDQAFVFLAGILHNCELWSSRLGFANKYANFFGVTCLHDGPYMAAYEAFEVYAAFDEALRLGGADLPPSARLLMSEYLRFGEDVLWSFYPDALPPEALSKEVRNGRIDRSLSIPLEDIYGDGSPAGQVGQEVYGAGCAFVLAARLISAGDNRS